MTQTATALASGKGHNDENFPVASFLIHPRHRPVIFAFYRFARTADDVADHPTAAPDEKLRLLADMEASLSGQGSASREGLALKEALAQHALSAQHAFDLLEAFRRDVTKSRYVDWNELMDYCRYSAMPVGRFVLDVHGEDRALWPSSDALCAALQVINHLQDCGKDYRELNRVYVPLDVLGRFGAAVDDLGAPRATPALRQTIALLAGRTTELLSEAKPFASGISDFRLGLEVAVIQSLAESLNRGLIKKDPLSQRVHHGKAATLGVAMMGALCFARSRVTHRRTAPQPALEP